jgi:hypothetical protein
VFRVFTGRELRFFRNGGRQAAEPGQIGRSGEDETPWLALLVHAPLQRHQQLRAALHLVKDHGAFQQGFRIAPRRRQGGEVIERAVPVVPGKAKYCSVGFRH